MNSLPALGRRRFLQLAGAGVGLAAASGVLSACGTGGAGSNSLQINSFGGAFQAAVNSTVVKPFQQKYNATVGVTTALSSAALTQLKGAPKGQPAFDVAYMDLAPIYQAESANLLQKFDKSKLPALSDMYPLAVDPNGYWIAELVAMTGIAYNTEKVTTPPTSWQDLWDPKYQGHVAISDISGTVGYQFLAEAAKLNGGSENNIDPGFAALKKLKPNIASIYKTPDQMVQLLTSGDAWLGPAYSDRTSAAKATGAPIGFVKPKEGAIAVLSCMCIPAGTQVADLAHNYVNEQISQSVNQKFVTAVAEGPTNSKVTLTDDFLSKNYVPYGLQTINSLVTFDYSVIAKQLSDWTSRWATDVAG
jgi:putative spermidine/putrescine transport system substrate-binding protein